VTLPAGYFDAMYANSPDPWSFRERWYEQRKRDVTMAALPARRYQRAFEPGCSIGLLTEALADRCDQLLAADASEAALVAARQRLGARPGVRLERRMLPGGWPEGEPPFDLVVLSELGYYFDAGDLDLVLDLAAGSLADGGTLVACHWRHRVDDYPLAGDVVHAAVRARRELSRVVLHEEPDFLLEVFTVGEHPTVAQWEGLVP
jgi:SAM-dependent methyltransferase